MACNILTMTKKILTISATTLFIIALGMIYYFFFFAKEGTSNPTGNTPTATNFFPFGQGGTPNQNQSTTTINTEATNPTQTSNYLEKLRLISNEPVAGATFIENKNGVYIRYAEKATGHVFDVSTFGPDIVKVSNTTIPKLHEVFFTEKGTSFIARYVMSDDETIGTIYAKIASTTTGVSLPQYIDSLAFSPSGTSIFYILKSQKGSVGILSSPNGSGKKQIWDSKIRDVSGQFAGENQVLITTKPNSRILGYSYLVNTKTGSLKSALQNVLGLSSFVNPSGTTALYYTSAGGGVLATYSLTNSTTTTQTPTTFPEKCVFDQNNKTIFYCAVSSRGLSPTSLDEWYLGLVSFSDNIWKYNTSTNSATQIEDLSLNARRDIDATNLQLNPAGSILMFQSKTDGSLWSLVVTQ